MLQEYVMKATSLGFNEGISDIFMFPQVPEYKPQAALQMFETFLSNGEYAPPLEIPYDLE